MKLRAPRMFQPNGFSVIQPAVVSGRGRTSVGPVRYLLMAYKVALLMA